MYKVVGTKGIVILLKNFDSLTAKIGDILDQACGEWYYLWLLRLWDGES